MKFTAREDVEAPIEFVFSQISDFSTMERSAMRRGAEVQRLDKLPKPAPGMIWDARFKLRGKMRELQLELTEYTPPDRMVLTSRAVTVGGHMVVDLVALSRSRTRMSFDIEIAPKNLSGRLLVQSLKLARKHLKKRLDERISEYSDELEARYKKSA